MFYDLVGFTAMSEAADPEDVDALLRTYHAAARKVIESFGGTVEKFIGDAVVGVFGVPASHEDDPERVAAGVAGWSEAWKPAVKAMVDPTRALTRRRASRGRPS